MRRCVRVLAEQTVNNIERGNYFCDGDHDELYTIFYIKLLVDIRSLGFKFHRRSTRKRNRSRNLTNREYINPKQLKSEHSIAQSHITIIIVICSNIIVVVAVV